MYLSRVTFKGDKLSVLWGSYLTPWPLLNLHPCIKNNTSPLATPTPNLTVLTVFSLCSHLTLTHSYFFNTVLMLHVHVTSYLNLTHIHTLMLTSYPHHTLMSTSNPHVNLMLHVTSYHCYLNLTPSYPYM